YHAEAVLSVLGSVKDPNANRLLKLAERDKHTAFAIAITGAFRRTKSPDKWNEQTVKAVTSELGGKVLGDNSDWNRLGPRLSPSTIAIVTGSFQEALGVTVPDLTDAEINCVQSTTSAAIQILIEWGDAKRWMELVVKGFIPVFFNKEGAYGGSAS